MHIRRPSCVTKPVDTGRGRRESFPESPGLATFRGALARKNTFASMFDSKIDHLNWVYVYHYGAIFFDKSIP